MRAESGQMRAERRIARAGLGLFALVAVILSCAAPQRQQPGGSPPPQPVEARRVVRVLGHESASLRFLERLAARDLARSGLLLEITARPTLSDLVSTLTAQRSSDGSDFDLVLAPQRALGRLVEAGVLAGLVGNADTDDRTSDFFDGWWRKTAWYRGRAYGYPFAVRTMSLWMRGDFWDEADADAFFRRHGTTSGPPRTWSDFERMISFQHRPDDGRFGTVIVGRADEHLWSLWLQFAIGFGARILDADQPDEYGAVVVNSPEAVRATELYARLVQMSPPDVDRFSRTDALRLFQEGRVAMGVMWHDLAPRMDDRSESRVPMRVGYEPVPSVDGTSVALLDSDLLLPVAGSVRVADATRVLQWALSHDTQRDLVLDGGFSGQPSVYADRAVAGHLLRHKWTYPRLVTKVVAVPTIPESDDIAQAMTSELAAVVAGRRPPAPALDRIAARVAELLKGKALRR